MEYEQERWAFDVEIFCNFFCVTFVKVDRSETKTFVIWKYRDDTESLFEFLDTNPFLVSFNGISYDMPTIRFIRDYRGKNLNRDLYNLSGRLISDRSFDDDEIKRLRYPYDPDYIQQDLMTMMNFHRTGVGLKQCSVNLRWHKVQDLPLKHDEPVTKENVDTIISYNLNDVLITIELYNDKNVAEARELREGLVSEFGYRVLSASKSSLANIILEAMYEKETGIPKKEFKELRTPRREIKLSSVILPEIKFKTKELNSLKERLLGWTLLPSETFNIPLQFKGNVYNIRKGGLHTKEKTALYRQTDSLKIMSMDVSSFYPAIMCEYRIKPEHLRDEYLTILSRVKRERLEAKKSGDKIKAESYKILINSIFGKSGFPDYWLYDPLALMRVTINGQLFLLMLVERMEEAGIHCISANTDGIEILVPTELEETAMSIAKTWEKETKFELEFVYYSLYAKRDVNSYIAITTTGKKKTKGAFLDTVELEKGYQHPIVAKAINNYLVNGTPAEETINSCKDILDFCISKKSDAKFRIEYRTIDGVKELQRTNRFYISTKGGSLQKNERSTGKLTGLFVGQRVTILNDYDRTIPFEEYDVKLSWYIKEANDLIEAIDPRSFQPSLFDGMNLDWGEKKKMECSQKTDAPTRKLITERDILESGKTKQIFSVSSKYGLVVSVKNGEKMSPLAEFYSLSKGTQKKFKIPKKTFEKNPLNVDDVVLLSSFEERHRKEKDTFKELDEMEWWLTGYTIIPNPTSILEKEV